MSWDKLTHKELLRTLDEDFAFSLTEEERKTKASTVEAVKEAELSFKDYLKANPEREEEFLDEVEKPKEKVTGKSNQNVKKEDIVVDNGSQATQPWLIKMTRENPLFEVGRYRFTDSHPYVLVDANDVDKVIAQGGFRQATPNELTEYYG